MGGAQNMMRMMQQMVSSTGRRFAPSFLALRGRPSSLSLLLSCPRTLPLPRSPLSLARTHTHAHTHTHTHTLSQPDPPTHPPFPSSFPKGARRRGTGRPAWDGRARGARPQQPHEHDGRRRARWRRRRLPGIPILSPGWTFCRLVVSRLGRGRGRGRGVSVRFCTSIAS